MKRLQEIQADLLEVTATCRPDMHEPDEQDLKAHVVGFKLDNANGARINEIAITQGWQEFVVCLERFDGEKFITKQINLADLIAIARMARLEAAPRCDFDCSFCREENSEVHPINVQGLGLDITGEDNAGSQG